MTLEATPSRPSLGMYGKLGEQTGVKDWAMRRIDKGSIPASSLRGGALTGLAALSGPWPVNPLAGAWPVNPLAGPWPVNQLAGQWPVNPLAETVAVDDWAMRRIDKGSIPGSSLRGLGEQTGVKDWAMRRIDKGSIPASSLRGLGVAPWPVNPLAGETHVGMQERRRYGKRAIPASSLRNLNGFGDIDGNVSTRTVQQIARKLGHCIVNGEPLAVDGRYGPQTSAAMNAIADTPNVPYKRTSDIPLWEAVDGSGMVRVDTAWWAQVTSAAAGLVDGCPGSSSSRTGTTTSGGSSSGTTTRSGGGTVADGGTDWMTWGLAGLAALAVGYVAYQAFASDDGMDVPPPLEIPEI